MAKDLYQILGIDRNASTDDIKRAYRKMSKELHPDKHKGDKDVEHRFKEVNEAYETLSDPKKRQMYDQFGSTGGAGESGHAGFGGGFNPEDLGGFSDIFESFFGGRQGGRSARDGHGGSIEVELTIDFATVVSGAKQKITLEKFASCNHCDSKGFEPGSSMGNCSECGGTGQVVRTAQSFFGTIQQTGVCQPCAGSGKVPEKPCKQCNGEGRKRERVEVSVDIPAGIHHGQSLRLRGEGDAGRQGAPAGDLFVHIRVQTDSRFERDNDDIRTKLHISVLDALLGAEKTVETVHGSTKLKIPEGTQPGQILRLKGKGLPVLNASGHGDHYVQILVEIPKKLNKKEKKLLEEWKSLS